MAYDTRQARVELLDDIADAIDALARGIAMLEQAYEQLDEAGADRIEAELFRPVLLAFGRAKAMHAGFAERFKLKGRGFVAASEAHPSQGIKGFLDGAVLAIITADSGLSELQDSMRPVDVGDAELRAGLADVRRLLAAVPDRARDFMRVLGR